MGPSLNDKRKGNANDAPPPPPPPPPPCCCCCCCTVVVMVTTCGGGWAPPYKFSLPASSCMLPPFHGNLLFEYTARLPSHTKMMMDLVPHPPTPAAVVHYFPDFGDFWDSETPNYNRRRSKSFTMLCCCVLVCWNWAACATSAAAAASFFFFLPALGMFPPKKKNSKELQTGTRIPFILGYLILLIYTN